MKVLVIGTGFGKYAMAPTYQRLGLDVQLLSSRDAEAVKRACAGDVDLVSIHSPPFLHHEHVMFALDHGHPVLCDKPFGRNANEARTMRDRAKAQGVLHFLNFELRFKPARAKAKALIQAGAIGRPQHMSVSLINAGFRNRKHGWLFERDKGGGWIGAWGAHAIDSLRWLYESEIVECGGLSYIDRVSRPDAEGVERPCTAEDGFSAWLKTAEGYTATLDSRSGAAANLPQQMILLGSEGTLELVDDTTLVLRRHREEQVFEFPAPESDPHFVGLVPWLSGVLEALREGRQIAPSFDDGVAAAEVMDRMRRTLAAAG
jgi:predicted dehydrogenase